jgi:glutaminase
VNSGRPGNAPLGQPYVSTGRLPSPELVKSLVSECYERFKSNNDGRNSDVYPALADVPQDLFGLCVVGVNGSVYASGDWDYPFSIMSVSKPFVFALVCQVLGGDVARQRLGVNATGLPFNSLAAVERSEDGRTNPMVNSGAIATTSLAPGSTLDEKWMFILDGLSRFAGRALSMNANVFASAAESNSRNQAIGQLLWSCGRLPIERRNRPLYPTMFAQRDRQGPCRHGRHARRWRSQSADEAARDRRAELQIHLGGHGDGRSLRDVRDWLYEVGLPGKSGIGGGIVTVSPGKGGLGTFAPRLDDAGNSIKGQLAAQYLSERLGLSLFASKAET